MAKLAERLLFLGGIVLFVYLLWRLGPATIAGHLLAAGPALIGLIIAQELLAYCANALGWYLAFHTPRPAATWHELLAARIAGDAINYLTPTAGLGGELVRAQWFANRTPLAERAAAVGVAKLTQLAGQILFIAIGLAVVMAQTAWPASIRHSVVISLIGFCVLFVAFLVAQRRGLLRPLITIVDRIQSIRPETRQRIEEIDAEIVRLHREARCALAGSTVAFFIGWALGLLECAVILWALDIPVTFERLLAIEVLSILIDGLLFFVPAKAGTAEGGKVLIFTLLGLDPAKGLSFGLLRRVRELSWAAVGLALFRSRRQES